MTGTGYLLKLFARWATITFSISLALFLLAGTAQIASLRNYIVTFSAFLLATHREAERQADLLLACHSLRPWRLEPWRSYASIRSVLFQLLCAGPAFSSSQQPSPSKCGQWWLIRFSRLTFACSQSANTGSSAAGPIAFFDILAISPCWLPYLPARWPSVPGWHWRPPSHFAS